MHVSRGVRYVYDASLKPGQQVVAATATTPTGQTLDLTKCGRSAVVVLASTKLTSSPG